MDWFWLERKTGAKWIQILRLTRKFSLCEPQLANAGIGGCTTPFCT